MSLDILLGLQWGDEGKGKIVDVLAPRYKIVARFQGGPNAGHTINVKGEELVLHTIPSGIIHEKVDNVIGSGMVIDPVTLKAEIEELKAKGWFDPNRLKIASNAHLILPSHRKLDLAHEKQKGQGKIGSTLKGIAPCYTDKTARKGLRVKDVFSADFEKKYQNLANDHLGQLNFINEDVKGPNKEEEEAWWEAVALLKQLKIENTENYLNESIEKGQSILAEGAQGTFLDLDFGSYPYVTSSNTIAANACLGLGISPKAVNNIYGVCKAYTTRVGEGPFPTELNGEEGKMLQEKGNEFGATTGRARRCGWLDLEALKYAVKINGITDLIITKMDVLKGMDKIKTCDGFEVNGGQKHYPDVLEEDNFTITYKNFESWHTDLSVIKHHKALPDTVLHYLKSIEGFTGGKVSMISTGPKRKEFLELA